MYIKIYFNQKPLYLCDTVDQEIEPFIHHDDAVFIDELNRHTVKTMIHEMQLEKVHAGVFLHSRLDELKREFYKKFSLVQAAGGLLQNEQKEILMIFRRGKWDLPKGKLDHGETLEACALREVEEETGVRNVQLIAPLLTTYHTYHEGARYILKESYWFRMHASAQQELVPQTEEGIVEIKWACYEDAERLYPECYPSVVDVIRKAAAGSK